MYTPIQPKRNTPRTTKAIASTMLIGWLFLAGQWQETPVTYVDDCHVKAPETLWTCFWYVEPGYPVVREGLTLNAVFLEPAWSPSADPIPASWVRSLARDDGAWGAGGGPSSPLVAP